MDIKKPEFQLISLQRRFVCSDHFESSSFEVSFQNDVRSEFYKRRRPKILLPNAVPSLRVKPDKPFSKLAKREQIRAHKQLIEELLNDSSATNSVSSDKTDVKDTCAGKTKVDSDYRDPRHKQLNEELLTDSLIKAGSSATNLQPKDSVAAVKGPNAGKRKTKEEYDRRRKLRALNNYGKNLRFQLAYEIMDPYHKTSMFQTAQINNYNMLNKQAFCQDSSTQTDWSWSPDVELAVNIKKNSQTDSNWDVTKSSKHTEIEAVSKEAEHVSQLSNLIQIGQFEPFGLSQKSSASVYQSVTALDVATAIMVQQKELVIPKVVFVHPSIIQHFNGVASLRDRRKGPTVDVKEALSESLPDRRISHERPKKANRETESINQIPDICENEQAVRSILDHVGATIECKTASLPMEDEYLECTPEYISPTLTCEFEHENIPSSSEPESHIVDASPRKIELPQIQIEYNALNGTYSFRKPS